MNEQWQKNYKTMTEQWWQDDYYDDDDDEREHD